MKSIGFHIMECIGLLTKSDALELGVGLIRERGERGGGGYYKANFQMGLLIREGHSA